MMAYDAADGYVVLFGGIWVGTDGVSAVTWTFAHGVWTRLDTPVHPQDRADGAMVYDPADHYVLLFGGVPRGTYNLGDTWAFRAGHWTELIPQTSPMPRTLPAPRSGAGMAYDAEDGYVLLFGGFASHLNTNSDQSFGDTWAFRGGHWTQLHPAVHPFDRWGLAMADDVRDGYVLAFGGMSASGGALHDSWAFHAGRWSPIPFAHQANPPPRLWRGPSAMADDRTDGYVVMFSGVTDINCPCPWNDTWVFRAGLWTRVLSPSSPPALGALGVGAANMRFDAATGDVLLFVQGNDVWSFDRGRWTQIDNRFG
jgi:hypothetical protein